MRQFAEDIVVIADMPGVDEKSVDITLEKNVLTIYGKVEVDITKDHRLAMSEYGIGDCQRVFTLSEEIDGDKIQATVKNGVLKLVMPKAESAKTRKIPIKAEGIGGLMNLNVELMDIHILIGWTICIHSAFSHLKRKMNAGFSPLVYILINTSHGAIFSIVA